MYKSQVTLMLIIQYIQQPIFTAKHLLVSIQFHYKCFQSGRTGKGSVVRLGEVWLLGHLGCDCSLKGSFHSVYWAI